MLCHWQQRSTQRQLEMEMERGWCSKQRLLQQVVECLQLGTPWQQQRLQLQQGRGWRRQRQQLQMQHRAAQPTWRQQAAGRLSRRGRQQGWQQLQIASHERQAMHLGQRDKRQPQNGHRRAGCATALNATSMPAAAGAADVEA